jgi:hypothetical protein
VNDEKKDDDENEGVNNGKGDERIGEGYVGGCEDHPLIDVE